MTISLHQHITVLELVVLLVVDVAVWGTVVTWLHRVRARRRGR